MGLEEWSRHALHTGAHSPPSRMMMFRLLLLSALLFFVTAATSPVNNFQEEAKPDESTKYCTCSGPDCQCCVDFNITYIDLGGPGCVKMKYISQAEGLSVNVSYGDSQLHQGSIKGDNITATCMDILLDLAQMCASFNNIAMTENGMKACVSLEPTFLGDPQDSYHLGCFDMGSHGMILVNKTSAVVQSTEVAEVEKPVNEESLIAVVNESAEEGIAWFSSFLGFNFGNTNVNTSSSSH